MSFPYYQVPVSNMDRQSNKTDDRSVLQQFVAKKNAPLRRISGICNVNVSQLQLGMLVQATEIERNGGLRIRVSDPNDSPVWRKTEWYCHKYDLIPVTATVWQFLAAVPEPQERVRLASDKQLCEDLKNNVQVNCKVWYKPDPNSTIKYQAFVKFMGPVPELGDGFYFGLDVLVMGEPSKTTTLTQKYFACLYSNGTFATLSNVIPIKTEVPNIANSVSTSLAKDEFTLHKQMDRLPSNSVNNYVVNRKKIVQNAQASFAERYAAIDDTKNNNRDVGSRLRNSPTYGVTRQSTESFPKNESSTVIESIENYAFPATEHKWSTDIESSAYSDLETNTASLKLTHNSATDDDNGRKTTRSENVGDLHVGSTVKVILDAGAFPGVIRWIGTPSGIPSGKLMAAVELEESQPFGTDGTYDDMRYFHCMPHRAVFADIKQCHWYDADSIDERKLITTDQFGNTGSSVIAGIVRPICVEGNKLKSICGKYRGIQGHHNSCYLDATLFSMFAFTSVFDNLLFRPPNEKDCPQYEEVQRVLREEIVNPLRKNMVVRADRVMKLRTLLEKLSSVTGLTSEEKDPEEFLTSLVAQILNAEPFLKLSSGQDAYHYQLFVQKDDRLNLPTVQQLLEQSFLTSNIKLKEVPSCFIIQMPRFGKSFKMYQKIQPTLLLDVTDIIEDSPRQCTICGKRAEYECMECYGQCGLGLESIAFCRLCLYKAHQHELRKNHEPKTLSVPIEFSVLQEHCPVPRLFLELSAVVCIETSHYVSFVKCGSGSDAPWCFFDSMADRKGEQNGYNIPEMVPCPDFPYWLSEDGAHYLTELTDDRNLPEYAKRLLCDAYMCMYQSPDVMMYK